MESPIRTSYNLPPLPSSSSSSDASELRAIIEKLEKRNAFLEKELDYVKSELQSTRRILTERDELLLHLQFDEEDDGVDLNGQKKKKSRDRVQTEERHKIQRLRSQMKIMENAIEEKDGNILKLSRELIDSKSQFQQHLEMSTNRPNAPIREMPQRSKTSWGFKSSPSASPMSYKSSSSASPVQSEPRFNGAAPSPLNSPVPHSPNFASSSNYASSSSTSMMEFDSPKKMQKKPSIFFKFKGGSKQNSPVIQETNWASQSQTPAH
ncbi:hypothetical protein CYY_006955 [Polysphondylium violaceum]|uniref:Uncharacterized protein n=1 Tax=Polysphondylium violaceum TaxID=133409 RepID=A0A8J4UR75_9MYCE|nr:hypothetical protein CYY_006955 [Polysphondylium violaceum]